MRAACFFSRGIPCLILGVSLLMQTAAHGGPADWDVAVIDQMLAGVAPGQPTVQVGDMEILGANLRAWRNQLAGGPHPASAFDNVPLWTGGNVYYTFSNNVSAVKQRAFLDGANEWATFANVRFLPRTAQANYVTIYENPSLSGGQSAVGMIGGQQFLQLGPDAWNHGTICHELGHTLGLIHEHQRSDRDAYVVVLTNNIIPGSEGNFVKLTTSQNIGPYDFYSVMHYGTNSFSVNPATLNTLLPQSAYSNFLGIIGGHSDPVLSPLDRAGMATNYGAGLAPSSVVTNTLDSGPGSLRAALYYAFDNPGTTITFNIPATDPGFSNSVFNVLLTDALPSLMNATVLDATTQPTNSNPNGPEIFLNGSLTRQLPVYPNGLRFRGSNCTARGFVVGGFPASGVLMDGSTTVSNSLTGCFLGVAANGVTAVSNGLPSVTISGGASFNRVGGTNAAQRNVIGGSPYQGLVIRDAGTRGNAVLGNFIGVHVNGTGALSNTWAGIQIFNGAQSNVIGGAEAGARNIISGNGLQGIAISGTNTDANVVVGNYIGLAFPGSFAVPNGLAGIDIFGGASSNRVGGFTTAERNVIAGNSRQGVSISGAGARGNSVVGNYVGLNATGTAAVSNTWAGVEISGGAQGSVIGGTAAGAGNVISGNGLQGVAVSGANTANTFVQGNILGLNPAGTAVRANGWSGVEIFSAASGTVVGGTATGAGNVISGNLALGVVIANAGTSNNVVQGNLIGLDVTGAIKGNGQVGVGIFSGASSNLVGGTEVGARNVISGNGNQGVVVANVNTRGNVVAGNYIGVNPAGDAARANAWAGVNLFNAAEGNTIGGASPGAGNLISGNSFQGVLLQDAGTRSNAVQGNIIGLNAAGTAALANGWSGVEIYNGPAANVIGGAYGARNFISGNGNYGVVISFGSSANQVLGNTIGLNISNSVAVPNSYAGVELFGGAVSNQIGGLAFGAANLISGNNFEGVAMGDASTTNNSVRGNSIFGNGGSELALYTGANFGTAAPMLSNAVLGVSTMVRGKLSGLASTTFQIDYYANPSGSPEARTYLGVAAVATSAGGTVIFTNELAALVPAGRVITATATDPAGNTSVLSAGTTVTATSTVNDGIPDAWRAEMFGGAGTTTNSTSCATCDPDGDGMDNRAEFLSGTNPTNAASVFKLTALNPVGSGLVAWLPSVTGINYRVEGRDDIATGGWLMLVDQVIGTGSPILITDTNATGMTRRFYRAGVQW